MPWTQGGSHQGAPRTPSQPTHTPFLPESLFHTRPPATSITSTFIVCLFDSPSSFPEGLPVSSPASLRSPPHPPEQKAGEEELPVSIPSASPAPW